MQLHWQWLMLSAANHGICSMTSFDGMAISWRRLAILWEEVMCRQLPYVSKNCRTTVQWVLLLQLHAAGMAGTK